MALKFQYNKTFLHQLGKQLKVRENALPTLQAKESALRLEVKRAKEEVRRLEDAYAARLSDQAETARLWREFPAGLLKARTAKVGIRKVAGVKVPVVEDVSFDVRPYSMVTSPAWVPAGIEIAKELATLLIERDVAEARVQRLEHARRKTTQKVNLYEKIQIPEYRESIRRIKSFLEDEENLAKSSQKILKARLAEAEAAL